MSGRRGEWGLAFPLVGLLPAIGVAAGSRLGVTAGPETALVAGLVQRIAGGDAPEKEESEDATWAGG